MKREREVNKKKEKVNANKEKETDKGKQWNISPFPSNTLLTLPNLGASIQFKRGQELTFCIHQTEKIVP